MNKSANQFNHLKVLSIKTYDKLQSGFVLLVVLVVLLFISGLTALMMSQNSVDVRSVLYHQNQYKLFISADKAVMNLWQFSPKHLVHMAQTDTWLTSLLSDKNDLTKIYTAQSCDDWQTFSISTLDDPPIQCHHTAPIVSWQATYIEPIGANHYLNTLLQNTLSKQSAHDIQNPDQQAVNDDTAHYEIFHLRLYAIAAQNSQDIIQCQEPLYQTRITTCLNDHGIIHKISVAEWLIWRQKIQKTDSSAEAANAIRIMPLRTYDIRSMRE